MFKWIRKKIALKFIKEQKNEIIEKIKETAKTKILGLIEKF